MASTIMAFKTIANGEVVYEGDSLEAAIRAWDRETYDKAHIVPGGIEARGTLRGLVVRDAWVLHVNADGVCYLNPNLKLT